jgi:hypothetical protein
MNTPLSGRFLFLYAALILLRFWLMFRFQSSTLEHWKSINQKASGMQPMSSVAGNF